MNVNTRTLALATRFVFWGGGKKHQTTFHHYRDLWMFDIQTKSWGRIETKVRPSARSGHRWLYISFTRPPSVASLNDRYYWIRMALWKHYIVLFGGFYDPGVRSTLIFLG